ncbi:hypothetical protein G3N96_04965 [Burkholderia sp. Se-20373]|uniref:hypothetical protein n=1 Tax=Burkholderia sp. Se-20373 TaxID=2703898 RepID=UPI00197FF53E|nr:hypothetical protein [Burkholderia sp. Se-20373]MBN3744787.1 hypothetical protein [Burkholderia sp. Se-20373]
MSIRIAIDALAAIAIDALAPIAKFEFISVAMVPYALMAALAIGCAFAIAALCLEGHKTAHDKKKGRVQEAPWKAALYNPKQYRRDR